MTLGEIDFSAAEFNRLVMKISVECVADGPDAFTVELDDSKDDFLIKHKVKIKESGSAIIKLGYTGGPYHKVMHGTITKIEARRFSKEKKVFTVKGFDYMHFLTREQHRRAWLNVKDSDIVSAIASEASMTAETEDSGVKHDYILQNNITNLEFLYERAQRCGFEVDCIDQKLIFKRPKKKGPVCTLVWDASNFTRGSSDQVLVKDCKFSTSTMGQIKKVVVQHYDPATKAMIEGSSDAILGASMGAEKTGADRAAEGANADQTTRYITDQPVRSVEDAEKLAWSILNQQAGMFVVAQGECEGDGRLKPGETVKMDSFGDSMDGEFFVTSAKHTMQTGGEGYGYVTEFEIRRTGK
jgi:phage protein D